MDKRQSETVSMPLGMLNKFANRVRLAGMLLVFFGGAVVIAQSNPAGTWLTGETLVGVSLMAAGLALAFVGERLWRMLFRNTSIPERQI